jgi:hypothetical protein
MNEPPKHILSEGLTQVLGALDEVTDDPACRLFILVQSLACDAIENRGGNQTWDQLATSLGEAIKIAIEDLRPLAESLQPHG